YYEIDRDLADRIRFDAARDRVLDRIVFVEETQVIEQYYRASDVFVLPSRRESFGMALVEAMASGLPCIASRLPRVTDLIGTDGTSGLLVEPHVVPALSAALARVLTDQPFAAALGRAARESVRSRFAIERTARGTLDMYRRVIRGDVAAPTFA